MKKQIIITAMLCAMTVMAQQQKFLIGAEFLVGGEFVNTDTATTQQYWDTIKSFGLNYGREKGIHTVTLNTGRSSSGVYICRMTTSDGALVREIMMIK